MSKKTFVLDTSVLLYDPQSIEKFERHFVVIPISVIEELDKQKSFSSDAGKNSRMVFRLLDSLNGLGKGNLHTGIEMPNGSLVRIQLDDLHEKSRGVFSPGAGENRTLTLARGLQQRGETVIFVSKDFAARVKAQAIGLEAEDYENLKYSFDRIYKGITKLEVDKHLIDLFFKDGSVDVGKTDFHPNEYCVLNSVEHSSAIGKYNPDTKKLESLIRQTTIWGLKPRNVEQKCAADVILRDDIKLVTLIGPAGTGKTLLALACGLRKVFDEGVYTKILVSRPIIPLGRDIGYLPGTKEEKLFHWMQPIYDNLEYLCESSGQETSETMRFVTESKKIEMEAVTYIRGRSLPKMFIIVDEAQNLTPHEVKTIISRAGEGTKVILTGDPTQIDNPYLDQDSNGLTYAVAKFSDQKIFGHITLEKTERSELAAIAAEIL